MTQALYDATSPQSILEFARSLSGKTLAEAIDMSQVTENTRNKGDLGKMVEKYYYRELIDKIRVKQPPSVSKAAVYS